MIMSYFKKYKEKKLLKKLWFELNTYSLRTFSGDYFCEHIKNYCDKNIKSDELSDCRLRTYFLSIPFPYHIFKNDKLICIDQPERSKREDLDCCKIKNDIDALYNKFEKNYENFYCDEISNGFKSLLYQSLIRCSELHGNMERDK